MLDKTFISVIVPVYNAEKHITKFINMLNNQTYKNFEVIFINDGSTDSSYDILKLYCEKDSRFKLFNKNNGGPSSARNMGIRVSSSDYLTFMDIDDSIMEDTLEIYIHNIKKYGFDVIRFNYYLSTINNKKEKYGKSYTFIKYSDNDNLQIKNETILSIIEGTLSTFIWVLVIKKEFLMSNNIFFDEHLKYMEDKVFYLDIFSQSENFIFLDSPTYFYYYDSNFLNKSSDFFIIYIQNVKEVFTVILKKIKGNDNLELGVKINAFRQLNNYLFILYNKREKNIKTIIMKFQLFDLFKPIPNRNDLNIFDKICKNMINYNIYFGLKIIYFLKKVCIFLKKMCSKEPD